jgi:asparagine synthetase B (glutamine-hydrolysing)
MTVQTLEPLELASGMVFGRRRTPRPDPESDASSPADALEQLLVPALKRTPCFVAYSGGRDSSALLAAATSIARRHGLDPPVPLTLRFSSDPHTNEAAWQELVIRHLGLGEWEHVELQDELDALGPIGRRCIARLGPYWPPLAHTWIPIFERAAGGSVIGGNGGDEFLSPWTLGRLRQAALLRRRPTTREMKLALLLALPRPFRIRVWRRRFGIHLPWLQPETERMVVREWALESTAIDRNWAQNLERLLASRYIELAEITFAALSSAAGVNLVEPFRSPLFVRALAAAAPDGFDSRADALTFLFGQLLPREVVRRQTKAAFTAVPWGPQSRRFAEGWTGAGVDHELVDTDALRAEWLSERPDFRSVTPLQSAWAATHC